MNTEKKDIENLLSNPSFRRWVFNATPELNLYWNNWIMQYPEKTDAVKKARLLTTAFRFEEKALADVDKLKLWRRIKATNEQGKKSNEATETKSLIERSRKMPEVNPGMNSRYLLRYAAVLTGLFVLAVAAIYFTKTERNEFEVQVVKKVNKPGQKSAILLADGTQVKLNASSTLTYPKHFSGEERKVLLEGEAFFTVKKGTTPFVVETEHLKVEVLGTSFNLRDFDENKEYALALVTGKVLVSSVAAPQDYLVLHPGQKGSPDPLTGRLSATAFDYDEEITWKEGILVFKETPFSKVTERLEAWYGVSFVLENEGVGDLLITGRFDNESLNNVLQSISYSGDFTYKIQGKEVFINFGLKP